MRKIGTDAYSLDTNGHVALLSSGRLILIDTGTKPDGEILLPEIEKTGYKVSDIEFIYITHTHPDHVGGLAKLKELTDAIVLSHELEAKYISKEEIYDGPPGSKYQFHPGTPVDVKLVDGQIYEGLLTIHTPGHTPGHSSFLDQEGSLLIAGDAFRNDPETGFGPMGDQYTLDPNQHKLSIKKLSNYNFERVILGHGEPVEVNGSKLLRQLVERENY
ncbi:MAG: MBL fold metallo-hydrolase [Candidatus Heimdallarchaeota archaeon]|nr:MBL fold metallo-hydrolase [Candidatus Heimdallarchaeota archaeon]